MLNRKKLIQLSLSEIPSETEFLDYKQEINLSSESGRGKLIRLICAMNNSNPNGTSFIFVGISDDKKIVGTNFLDDADFQNSTKGFITDCPKLSYENIIYGDIPTNKFIGIITIYPNEVGSSILKKIWKLSVGDKFIRRGSTTDKFTHTRQSSIEQNEVESNQLINKSNVSLKSTLDAVLAFYSEAAESYKPKHYVFNDQYVVGISAWKEAQPDILCEVTISLINESITYFWGALEYVKINILPQSILVEEQKLIFWQGKKKYMPFKKFEINFAQMSSQVPKQELLFSVPTLTEKDISNFINSYSEKVATNRNYLEILPYELLLAALNGSDKARDLLFDKNNGKTDGAVSESYYDAISTYNQLESAGIFEIK